MAERNTHSLTHILLSEVQTRLSTSFRAPVSGHRFRTPVSGHQFPGTGLRATVDFSVNSSVLEADNVTRTYTHALAVSADAGIDLRIEELRVEPLSRIGKAEHRISECHLVE